MNEQLAQALAQLRDIHEPAAPVFWPIPLGWWLLALCLLGALVSLLWWLHKRRVMDRPYRTVRETASQLQILFRQDGVTEQDYVSAVNRLYKHLLVDIEATPGSAKADGTQWLEMLAVRFDDDAFKIGAGKALGTIRYAPVRFFDDQLVELVERTLCHVKTAPSKVLRT